MNELIITALPGEITGNFEEIKAELLENIKLYEIEVTEETLPEAKKMATELNKLSTAINKLKIDKAKEFSAPIEEFKAKTMELIAIIQGGREKILKQAEGFEEKMRLLCKSLLQELLEQENIKKGIDPEFRSANIEKLAIKSNLTAGGKLTSSAITEVYKLVNADLSMQGAVKQRLASLAATCERAGLQCEISASQVTAFIREPEAIYSTKLNALLDAEIARQKAVEAKMKAEADKKAEAERKAAEDKRAEEEKWAAEAQKVVVETKPEVLPEPEIIAVAPVASTEPVEQPEATSILFTVMFRASILPGQDVKKFVAEMVGDKAKIITIKIAG